MFDNESTSQIQTYEWYKQTETAEIRSKILHVVDENIRQNMNNMSKKCVKLSIQTDDLQCGKYLTKLAFQKYHVTRF